jgi:hypothetical protein
MEGRVHEREIEAGLGRGLTGVPPDGATSITQSKALNVVGCTFDRARVRVRQQNTRLRPECCGCDTEHAGTTPEVNDSLGRFVAHETRQRFEQELASGIELLRAEDAGPCLDLEFEMLAVDGVDRGRKRGGFFKDRATARVFLESNHARPSTVGDDDGCLIELAGQTFDRGNDAD